MSTEDGEVLWLDEEFDAAGGTQRSSDEADTFECEDHLMDAWRSDLEVALHVLFGRRTAEDTAVSIDEGQVLTLFVAEGGRRRGHVPNI